RYVGRSREEVLAQRWLPLLDESASADGLTPAAPVSVVEYQVNRPDGRRCWQRWAERALFDDDGVIQEIQSIGADVTERKYEEQRNARLLEQNRALARRSLEIQEQERARLARELHDELGQCLTAIRADAELIRGRAVGRDAVVHESAQAIDQVAEQVYGVVRRMMRRLRPASLDELGLVEALQETVQEWAERHPEVRCRLDADGEWSEAPKAVGTTAYRVVQEALTNVAKHADAGSVTIRLQGGHTTADGGRALWVEVTDDGRGIDPETTVSGFGMLGMRERVHAVGGELDLESRPGEGTTVRARLPLDAADAGETP
ncbi:MAG TPA: ATP-binding protein, partial [Gammaproteobacteria bacterium]|nr:ATP-binding protein [Gammaproteobacteria bacterium]